MEIIAYSNDLTQISIEKFFSKYKEFSENPNLVMQTTRFLKILLRHPDDIAEITDEVKEGYSFQLSGTYRTYTVIIDIINDSIVLKKLC